MGQGTDRAIWIRKRLRARRLELGLSQQIVADLISDELGRAENYSKQMISLWESFKSQPAIDVLAAWARVLGLRMDVDLVDKDDGRVPTRLHPDIIEIAQTLEALCDEDRAIVDSLVASLYARRLNLA